MTLRTASLLFIALLFASCASQSGSKKLSHYDGLGSLSFPNSGSDAAQDDFLQGVLLLHSFEFGPAGEHFKAAQAADSSFALAYWGEAMTYNHPLWRQVDLDMGREILGRLGPSTEERLATVDNDRERLYMEAVEALYGEGSKADRDKAYMEAMERLHTSYPADDEATTFYALSILGSTNGERDYDVYQKAAATVIPVFERNPLHPGAAHYIIHSYDDPDHAHLGLEAAEAYADIAPNAGHAQHMTTHIFVALGLWDRVVENNIRAMNTQNKELADRGLEPNHCGHYSSWRHYGHLQLRQFTEAESLMDACHAEVIRNGNRGAWTYFSRMRSSHVIDSEDWSLRDRWVAVPPTFNQSNSAPGSTSSLGVYHFANSLALLRTGNVDEARKVRAEIPDELDGDKILRLELEGLLTLSSDNPDGMDMLAQAATLEESFPMMFGPPTIVKPTYELLGEELLKSGDTEGAAEAFKKALLRTPGRYLTVVGAEKANVSDTGTR
ncbi:MAG: hypothetical protein HKN43_13425 [Rhodothermales bacterium]|nr:hypothetical protein [Rhodothermales bacterium]